MPDPPQSKIRAQPLLADALSRSFAVGEEDGYQTDTFSRNDREGLPSEAELTGREASSADIERALDVGEEDGYRTDTFSRNDGEGLPSDEELIEGRAKAKPADSPLKATDDPDSREAVPPTAQGGGVR